MKAVGTASEDHHQRAILEKQRMLLQGKVQAVNAKVTELKHTAPVGSTAKETSDLGLHGIVPSGNEKQQHSQTEGSSFTQRVRRSRSYHLGY